MLGFSHQRVRRRKWWRDGHAAREACGGQARPLSVTRPQTPLSPLLQRTAGNPRDERGATLSRWRVVVVATRKALAISRLIARCPSPPSRWFVPIISPQWIRLWFDSRSFCSPFWDIFRTSLSPFFLLSVFWIFFGHRYQHYRLFHLWLGNKPQTKDLV